MTFKRAVSFKDRGLKSDCLTFSEWDKRNERILFWKLFSILFSEQFFSLSISQGIENNRFSTYPLITGNREFTFPRESSLWLYRGLKWKQSTACSSNSEPPQQTWKKTKTMKVGSGKNTFSVLSWSVGLCTEGEHKVPSKWNENTNV